MKVTNRGVQQLHEKRHRNQPRDQALAGSGQRRLQGGVLTFVVFCCIGLPTSTM
jgi:hypothetical protein